MKTTDIGFERFSEDFAEDPITAFIKDMRDATPEEEQAIQENIKKISKPTGINFYDYLDQVLKNDSWDDVGTGCFAYWNEE